MLNFTSRRLLKLCEGVTAFEKGNLADLGHTKLLKEHMRNVGKDKSDMSNSEEQDKKRMKFGGQKRGELFIFGNGTTHASSHIIVYIYIMNVKIK